MKRLLIAVIAALLLTSCNPAAPETQSQPDSAASVTISAPAFKTSSMTEEPPKFTPLDESEYSIGYFENATDDFILSLLRCPQYCEKYADATKILLTESDNQPLLVLNGVGTFICDGENFSYREEIIHAESDFFAEKIPREPTSYESETLGKTRFSLLTNDIAELADEYYISKIDYSAYSEKTIRYLENFFKSADYALKNTSGLQILDMNGDKNPEFVLYTAEGNNSSMSLFSSDSEGNVTPSLENVSGEEIKPYRLYGGETVFTCDGGDKDSRKSDEHRCIVSCENNEFALKTLWSHTHFYRIDEPPFDEYVFDGKKVSEEDYNFLVKDWENRRYYNNAFYIAQTDELSWTYGGKSIKKRLAAAELLEKFFADSAPALVAESIPKKGSVTYEQITPQPIAFGNSGYIYSAEDYPEKKWLDAAKSAAKETEIYIEAAKIIPTLDLSVEKITTGSVTYSRESILDLIENGKPKIGFNGAYVDDFDGNGKKESFILLTVPDFTGWGDRYTCLFFVNSDGNAEMLDYGYVASRYHPTGDDIFRKLTCGSSKQITIDFGFNIMTTKCAAYSVRGKECRPELQTYSNFCVNPTDNRFLCFSYPQTSFCTLVFWDDTDKCYKCLKGEEIDKDIFLKYFYPAANQSVDDINYRNISVFIYGNKFYTIGFGPMFAFGFEYKNGVFDFDRTLPVIGNDEYFLSELPAAYIDLSAAENSGK